MIARHFHVGRLRAHFQISKGFFNFTLWRLAEKAAPTYVPQSIRVSPSGEEPFPGAGLS